MQKIALIQIPMTPINNIINNIKELFDSKGIFPGNNTHSFLAAKNNITKFNLLHGVVPYSLLKFELSLPLNDYFTFVFLTDPIAKRLHSYRVLANSPITSPLRWNTMHVRGINEQVNFLSALPEHLGPYTTQQHLESAKETIASLSGFGLIEKFPDSFRLLNDALTRLGYKVIKNTNISYPKPQIDVSPEVLSEIHGQEWADLELYKFALALFEQRTVKQ